MWDVSWEGHAGLGDRGWDGEVGVWGFKALEVVVMLDCREMENGGQRGLQGRLSVR